MSTCISRHGEFSMHEFGTTGPDRFVCTLCGSLAEDALFEALEAAERAAEQWETVAATAGRLRNDDMSENQRLRDGITTLADEWLQVHPPLTVSACRESVRALLNSQSQHPEDYCHRCGGPNISWYTPGGVWDPVMRPVPSEPWKWNEIICPLCFVELAGGGTWALIPTKDDGEAWTSADEREAITARALLNPTERTEP